ncbi:M56 family metallopeptidase [Streptomyces sp. HSW2009]|uniref:M56 family metallopeptidase n=1 Tax=Streptomyces sp. HSW2009 TaxID=3142890 RepID=UPI0032ED6E8C
MGVFVVLPLVLPLTAWPISRLAERRLHPRTATVLLTAVGAILAVCSTLCLALLVVVGTAQVPGNPLPDGWAAPEVRAAVPYDENVGFAAIAVLAAVTTACGATLWRHYRVRGAAWRALEGLPAQPAPGESLELAKSLAVAGRSTSGEGLESAECSAPGGRSAAAVGAAVTGRSVVADGPVEHQAASAGGTTTPGRPETTAAVVRDEDTDEATGVRGETTPTRPPATALPQVTVLPDELPYAYALPGSSGAGRVVVSDTMLAGLTEPERQALIAHERAHLAARHHRYLLASRLTASANPFLRPLWTAVSFSAERWADEEAAREVGNRRVVATAVGKAALLSAPAPAPGIAGFASTTTPGPIPRRIAALLSPVPPTRLWPPADGSLYAAALIAAAGTAASALSSLNAAVALIVVLKAATSL